MNAALRHPIALAAVVCHVQHPAFQHGAGHGTELAAVHPALAHALQANAGEDGGGLMTAFFEEITDAHAERIQMRAQQTGLHVFQGLFASEERVNLAGIEPQTGQFESRRVRVVAVSFGGAVIDDRCVHEVTHVFQITHQRGTGNGEGLHHALRADRAFSAQESVEFEEAFDAIQRGFQMQVSAYLNIDST